MNFKTIEEFIEKVVMQAHMFHVKNSYNKETFLFAWDEKRIYMALFDYMFSVNMYTTCEILFHASKQKMNRMYLNELKENLEEYNIVVNVIENIIDAYTMDMFEGYNTEGKYAFYVEPDGTIHGGLKEDVLKDFI